MGRRRRGQRGSNPYDKPDRFTKQAQEQGYAARSVFKLQEIQRRFTVLRPGQRVLDLGCSPGSWLAYAAEQIGRRGTLVGIDLNEPKVSHGTVLVRSIFDVSADELRVALDGPADVVLSDMAPLTSGDALSDHVRQLELARRALGIAVEVLAPRGAFVVKVFEGEDAHAFVQSIRPHFGKVKRVRPEAVRKGSREFFVVGTGFAPSP